MSKTLKQTIDMKNVITLITMIFVTGLGICSATNLDPVVNLSGYWKFSIGDDMLWAQKDFNDSQWDNLRAPGRWEDQGYVGYDGYAWYRKKVTVSASKNNKYLYLRLGKIDDVNQVYFNGVRIGQLGKFPPKFKTAYDGPLLYPVPEELINFNGENTIAVRVYDEMGDGGIVSGQLAIGYDADLRLLAQNLSGNWKISFKNIKGCKESDYDDSGWRNILVPATWESQGYNNYDGYVWYRKSFSVSADLVDQKLYLILGKIDDKDKAFINGKEIGTYKDMYNTPFDNNYQGNWQLRRAYRIPAGLLKPDGNNVITVLVSDEGGMGGIHEGPVGLMTRENYEIYKEEYEKSDLYFNHNPIWEILSDIFEW